MNISSQSTTRFLDVLSKLFFCLTIILIPFRERIILLERPLGPIYSDFTDYVLYAADIPLLVTVTLWLISLKLNPRRIIFGRFHIWVPLYGLVIAGWLSTITSEYRELSAYHVLRFVILFLLYLFVVNEIDSPKWIILGVISQLLIQAPIAIGQSLLQRSIGLQNLGELQLDPAQAGSSIVYAGGIRYLRSYGLADHPNILAGCTAIGLLILTSLILRSNKTKLYLAVCAIVPSLVMIALTFSRSAWLGLICGIVLLLFIEIINHGNTGMKRIVLLASVVTFTLTPIIVWKSGYFGSRLNINQSFSTVSYERDSLNARILLNKAANRIFVEHPINGIGLGAAPLAMLEYYPDFPIDYQPPHYAWLTVGLETGLIGAIPYFILMILPILMIAIHWKKTIQNPALVASTAVLIALVIIGFFDYYPWTYNSGRLIQWLAWGYWSAGEERL